MGRGQTIAGRKNAEDARRGKAFTKLIREITVAARGGGDPSGNPRLRLAIDKALSANMSKDTVERAIKRGSGAEGADDMQEIRYEGYGPGGVALIIDTMTDNLMRTVADVRHALSKHSGNLGTAGSVAYQFNHLGEIVVETADDSSEEALLDAALEAGADDVQSGAGLSTVLCAPASFEQVKLALSEGGFKLLSADLVMRPDNRVAVPEDLLETLYDLLDRLEDLDDVQEVYHNADLPEEEPEED